MANTTNFGWETPDDTDLVKDGAAAIRTVAGAIDTSLVDLKGGTTNQVLAKNSNTDMDFKWVADAAGMTNPMTTTGDTIYSSSGSTPARLAIGSTGNVLTVAGGVPTWAAPAGGGKVLQVVSAVITTQSSNSTTTFADSNITLSITPTSATSKVLILVTAQVTVYRENIVAGGVIKLMRDATDIFNQNGDASLQTLVGNNGSNSLELSGYFGLTYLDSPATTAATTYKIQGKRNVFSPTANASIIFQNNLNSSTITLLEIGA
jgi:hypothetical protein